VTGRVSLARRNLFQDRRRALLAITGVAASLVLVLVLDGVFAGAMHQVTAYMRSSPADVFVSQQDVRTMHMSASAIPPDTVDTVRSVDGVAWAEALRYTTSIVDTGASSQLTYVFGYDVTTGRAGPRHLAAAGPPHRRGPRRRDRRRRARVTVGGAVRPEPCTLRVSGLSTNGTNIVNTTVFIRPRTRPRDTVAYVLAGADPGVDADTLAHRGPGAARHHGPDPLSRRSEANVVRIWPPTS
jgi:putative ABC transport system permease protein